MSIIPNKLITISPTDTNYGLSLLLEMFEDGDINLNPEYQRDESLWSDIAKVRLIQSILGGIHIPQLTFNNCSRTNKITVIDGKQRLSTIFAFMKDKFKFYNDDDPYASCKFSELDSADKKKIKQYNLHSIKYSDLDDDEQREIFERVNHGISLSTGERIKGLKSPFIRHINDLVKKLKPFLIKINLGNKTLIKRYFYHECTVAIIILEYKKYNMASKGAKTIKFLKETAFVEDDIVEHCSNVFINFKQLIQLFDEIYIYFKKRQYKLKWNWTIIYLFYYMISIKTENSKIISTVFKYLHHIKNENEYITDIDNDAFRQWQCIRDKRPITSSLSYFEDRSKALNTIYKHIQQKPSGKKWKDLKNRVYAKTGTIGASICKICKKHEIHPDTFHVGHKISKYNGGTYDNENLEPICSYCNGPKCIGKNDMDHYIKDKQSKASE